MSSGDETRGQGLHITRHIHHVYASAHAALHGSWLGWAAAAGALNLLHQYELEHFEDRWLSRPSLLTLWTLTAFEFGEKLQQPRSLP